MNQIHRAGLEEMTCEDAWYDLFSLYMKYVNIHV